MARTLQAAEVDAKKRKLNTYESNKEQHIRQLSIDKNE